MTVSPYFPFIFISDDAPCGRQTIPLEPESNIAGGKLAQEGEWPWQAYLWITNEYGGLDRRCGATVLMEDWVLTTAHCM